jgi:hypothetical protein
MAPELLGTYRETVTNIGEDLHVEALLLLCADLDDSSARLGREELVCAWDGEGNRSWSR